MAELDGALVEAAQTAAEALDNLLRPLTRLGKRLEAVLEDAPDWLDGAARARIEGALGSLGWRCDMVAGWLSLLSRVGGPADPDFVDWLAIDRFEGREYDIGIRSEEHTSELQSLMRISYAVCCLKNKTTNTNEYSSRETI